MSQSISGEPRIQDIIDAVRVPYKCRIPQRLHPDRQSQYKNNLNNADVMVKDIKSQKFRTKSTSRARSNKETSSQIHDTSRYIRSSSYGEKNSTKKQPVIAKRNTVDQKTKVGRPVITVPVQQKPIKTLYPAKNCRTLPDQQTINQYEELEVQERQQCDQSNETFEYADPTDINGEIQPENEKIGDIHSEWQINNEFQNMRIELKKRQEKAETVQNADASSTDDFYTMNILGTQYDKLPKICAETKLQKKNDASPFDRGFPIDVLKFYTMPSKLVDTCERALVKRQEIIDWLDSLKTKVSNNSLAKKINEFNSENENLRSTLANVKNEFMKELQDIENYIRQRVNDTMAMHLQAENMTYKLSELNEQNANLRKQLNNAQNCKTYLNRNRIAELEKESKEKHRILRERLSKTESQVRAITEQASQLESTLEKLNIKLESKEATITELQEQNLELQRKYDEELKILHESIKENTKNLEAIEKDRDNLQAEKDNLEKQLIRLTQYYNESLNNNAVEMKLNIEKLNETETKYNIELEEKDKLKARYCEQLLEAERRNKDLEKKIQEVENQISNTMVLKQDHEKVTDDLEKSLLENKKYKNLLLEETDKVKNIEHILNQSTEENQELKENLEKQQKYILELKNREDLIKVQLNESEAKIETYEYQIKELKNTIEQIQTRDDDINTLRDTIAKQETDLVEATMHNKKLSESIEKTQNELIQLLETNKKQEQNLRDKDDVIKSLSKVEEEQSDVIKQLRKDIENRANADTEIIHQMEQKNFEITTLSNNLGIRNEQILQLEKIILTLEDKVRKASLHQKNYEDTIHLLEMKIKIYESHYYKQGVEATSRNLDHFLKLLEDEMADPLESNDTRSQICPEEKRIIKDEPPNNDKLHDHECCERQFQNPTKQKICHKENSSNESSLKTACHTSNDESSEGANRKKSKASIDKSNSYVINRKQNTVSKCKPNEVNSREKILTKKLQLLGLNKHELEKRSKMFALAGHRL